MCRLCWAYHLAYRTETEPLFDSERFAQLSEEQQTQTVFQLPRSAQFIESPYPLKKIWDLCQPDQANEAGDAIDLDAGRVKLLVWRDQNQVNIEELNDDEWQLTNLLNQQLPLEQLEQYCASHAINLAQQLPAFLRKGWLARPVTR